jgi:two-component system response regulator
MSYEPIDCPAHILLVEDDPDDVEFVRRAFAKVWINYELRVARDGQEAMEMLRNAPGFEDAPKPDLILLDLNMPRKNGFDVLGEVKTDEELKHIPVVVLTTSAAPECVLKSYRLHANSVITKPIDLSSLNEIVRMVAEYWFTAVGLPKRT